MCAICILEMLCQNLSTHMISFFLAGVPKFILISVHDYNLPSFLLSSAYFTGKRKAESEVLSKYPNSGNLEYVFAFWLYFGNYLLMLCIIGQSQLLSFKMRPTQCQTRYLFASALLMIIDVHEKSPLQDISQL